ncbi:hypothetical protein [Streptomyces sp. NPDC046805]
MSETALGRTALWVTPLHEISYGILGTSENDPAVAIAEGEEVTPW